MIKLKFIIIFIVLFTSINYTEALDIQYGSVVGYKNSDVLIEYYGIEKKNNYICNILNYKCTVTKKTNLNNINPPLLKNSIKKELKDKKANHEILSKDGKWLAYYNQAKEPENTRIYTIKNIKNNHNYTSSGNVSYWDLVNEQSEVFEFSPDGTSLVYIDDKNDAMSLYKVDLKSLKNTNFESTKIEVIAYTVETFMFFDSQNIYYIGNTKENPYKWSLYHLNLKTGKDEIIESDVSYVDKIIKIGSSIIFNHLQEKGYGPEIYNTKTKKINQFKIPNINNNKNIINEEYIKVGNSIGVVMTPLSFDSAKTYPLLIWLHGGPIRQASLGYHPYHSYGIYDSILKLLQKNNVIILKLDYRGSLGNGRAYSERIQGSVGKGDIDDVIEAISYERNEYHINDVYLAGNSYGGYMSLRTAVEYPDKIKGVFSINGVTDWESLLIKMKNSIFNTQFYGLPNSKNKNLYDQASIINRISNLGNQKIEIIQGEADRTIPLWQAILLSTKLKEANKNIDLVTYKGEDHVFKYKKNISDVCVRLFGLIGIPTDNECTK